ncbi:GHKL domain-containing protein [Blautia producta]|nr:GHKL domain-containing protein [Blautia producta]
MGERLYTLIEICNIICCLHFIHNKKVKIDIQSILLICTDSILFELINIYDVNRNLSMLMYFLIFLYIIAEFGADIKCAVVANLIYVIVLGVGQLVGVLILTLLRLESLADSLSAIVINLIAFIILLLIRRELHSLYKFVIRKNFMVFAAFLISFLVIIKGIVQYKKEMETSVGQFMMLLLVGSLTCILVYSWQNEKENKAKVERELQMHKMYDNSFASLIATMRKKQHEFHNHLQAIVGMHYMLKTYEELVEEQQKYVGTLLHENKFYGLLSSNWPVLAGFLYSKFLEADAKGIGIKYTLGVELEMCRIPEFVMIEILGILLDNAIEAVEKIENPMIYVRVVKEESFSVQVANTIEDMTYGNVMRLFDEGYSSKKGHQGLGLHKIAEYGQRYHFEPRVLKINFEERDCLVMIIDL